MNQPNLLKMLFQLLLSVLIFITTTVISYFEIQRIKKSQLLRHIPTIKECPIIGTTMFFKFYKMTEFKRYMDEMITAPVCKIFAGSVMAIFVSDPEILYEIANSKAFAERPFVMRYFPWPMGLLTAERKL